MNNRLPLLQSANLVVGYRSGSGKTTPVAGPLEVEIHAGQLVCLLGPNGSGKSTLLRTLAGLQSPLQGTLAITGAGTTGKPSPAQLAKKISLVLTDSVRFSNLTVYSLVALGRYPYSNWLGILSATDKAVIAWAIEATRIEPFLDRKMNTLSDGESQKVMLARALAQDTPLLMLDEPTAHLDLPSRIQLIRLLHQLARQTRKGILLSTHELDLALQVADEVWLLQPSSQATAERQPGAGTGPGTGIKVNTESRLDTGSQLNKGAPEDLVLNGIFEAAFEKEGIRFDKTTGAFNMHPEDGHAITVTGEGASAFWTKRAVQRQGFTVNSQEPTDVIIRVWEEDGRPHWILEQRGSMQRFETMAGLLEALTQPKN